MFWYKSMPCVLSFIPPESVLRFESDFSGVKFKRPGEMSAKVIKSQKGHVLVFKVRILNEKTLSPVFRAKNCEKKICI